MRISPLPLGEGWGEGLESASFIDLHSHSTASDGTLAPAELIREAKRAGLSALALTDHDTIDGNAEASAEAKTLGIDFLPGIEISCQVPRPATMHLLGYGVDVSNKTFSDTLRALIEARDQRNLKIVEALQTQGVAITLDEVEREAGGDVVGRPHMAAILVRKGYVSSVKQAFDKYLGQGGSAYFDKERLTQREAIDLVHKSRGLIVLAHPVQLRTENSAQLERIIKGLKDQGLDGIETIHSDHDDATIEQLTRLANKYSLLKTGGSDFHGGNKPDVRLGQARNRRIPREMFNQLISRLKTRV
jgi:predicted metal-dependent phosphoesterase TrpH